LPPAVLASCLHYLQPQGADEAVRAVSITHIASRLADALMDGDATDEPPVIPLDTAVLSNAGIDRTHMDELLAKSLEQNMMVCPDCGHHCRLDADARTNRQGRPHLFTDPEEGPELRADFAPLDRVQLPLLGICLGSQWINVAHGGSLFQDIPSAFGINHRGVSHPVRLESGTRLSGIFGKSEFEVNSFHHQSVRRVGDGLRVAARCPNGVVEAVETTNPDRFLIGVQWHPEKLVPENKLQARLIRAFIVAASKKNEELKKN